ncbi:MAG: thiamine pyrophosphate-dependent enzyme [Pirellulales bacterium]
MRVAREHFHSVKQLPRSEQLSPGSPMCAGCGGLESLRLIHNLLGENVVFVNAAGCMTLMATFPYTPLHGSWLYTNMASAAAGAQGVRDALDIRLAAGELSAEDDLQVVVLAGDGSTFDMGLSSTSAAIHRRLDFWYLCYDNEAYGNTGFQLSASSPQGSLTATTHQGATLAKKDLFEIWRAHRPPYVATLSPHEPLDLAEKIERAKMRRGPKLLLTHAVCPTGWGFDPALSDQMARLAIETGVWPLKEAVDGVVRHTYRPSRFLPVEEYLKPQRRFRHLFVPQRDEAMLTLIQSRVNEYWRHVEEA